MASSTDPCRSRGVWSASEHERFLEALAMYPQGPWTLITAHIGTRSAKQVQTHAQKYQHKLMRHQRGLRKWKTKSKRPEHRVDATTADQLMNTKGWSVRPTLKKDCDARREDEMWSSGSEETASEYSGESDSSTQSELDAIMEGIEPVPFQFLDCMSSLSAPMGVVHVQEDHDLFEAFAAIMSWPSSHNVVV